MIPYFLHLTSTESTNAFLLEKAENQNNFRNPVDRYWNRCYSVYIKKHGGAELWKELGE